MTKNDYDIQAEKFLNDTETEMTVKFLSHGKHFPEDEKTRDIYFVQFKRGNRSFDLKFGQSISGSSHRLFNLVQSKVVRTFGREELDKCFSMKTGKFDKTLFGHHYFQLHNQETMLEPEEPSAYDVLSCLSKNDPGTFENFCAEFGYDEDSKRAEKTYKAVLKEWKDVQTLWNDQEIERLQEIQ